MQITNNLFKEEKVFIFMKKINKIFNDMQKSNLLDDRSEYDEEDLRTAYNLNKKESKLLSLKIRKWKIGSKKDTNTKPLKASSNSHIKLKPFNSVRVLKTK